MKKKIVGYKLIKEYPGTGPGRTGLGMIVNTYGSAVGNYYANWPEFWEPIYKECVDLEQILKDSNDVGMMAAPQAQNIIYKAMKEACRQTLELVVAEIDSTSPMLIEKIRNLINKIQ
jgi:hypothetical protein